MTRSLLGQLLRLGVGLVLAICLLATSMSAQTPGGGDGLFQQLIDKAGQLDRDVQELLKQLPKPIPTDPADQKLIATIEMPTLPTRYWVTAARTQNEYRLFVAKLTLLNLTPQLQTIEPAQITLDADGQKLTNGVVDAKAQAFPIQIGQQGFVLSQLKPTSLKIAPGMTASTWIVFGGLPRGPQVPPLKLLIAAGDTPLEIDLNAEAVKQLMVTSQRMGPRGCLALLTLNGEINLLTYSALIAELERLLEQKVTRVVIRWTDTAPPINDVQLNFWLLSSVQLFGRENQNTQFPALPTGFSEFRLAELPFANRQAIPNVGMYGGLPTSPTEIAAASPIHATTSEAVTAALRTAYEVLPRNELLSEIQTGEVMTRCAALTAGAARLSERDLPLLFELAEDREPAIQKAAIQSLRHFGDSSAIHKLLELAKSQDESVALSAVESLAASRYADAHEAVLKLLEDGAVSRKVIVKALAQNPRPRWSETIYKHVRDRDTDVGADGLQALIRVGHPHLHEVLAESLTSNDPAIRDVAYLELANRNDSVSEAVALQFTLRYLETSPPSPTMLAFLIKTKEQSAVPLLLKYLKVANVDRPGIISTLAQIGDQSVAAALAENFDGMLPAEKMIVLAVLGQLKSPLLLELAASALAAKDQSLVNGTCHILTTDGRPTAAKLLIEAFEKSDDINSLSPLSNALSSIASREARQALMKARSSPNPQKQSLARNALLNLFQNSPAARQLAIAKQFETNRDIAGATQAYGVAIQVDPEIPEVHLARGAFFLQEKKFDEALKDYDRAIQIDPDHAPSYIARANVFMRQNKFAEAQTDFEKAWSLDKTNGEALTGVGITLAIAGKFEEAITLLEEHRTKFQNDALFSYNAACVYGRAAEAVQKNEKLAERDQKLADFRAKAINDLRDSLKNGFNDLDWMKKDPDLNSLHGMPEFKELAK